MDRRIVVLGWLLLVGALVLRTPHDAAAAVTISSFNAQWQSGKIVVTWKTASELNNAGFNILRSESANGTFSKVNFTPSRPECMGSVTGCQYSFTDSSAAAGKTYYYKLQSIDTSGGTDTYSQTAVASAPATPTPTATATRTRTPTRTATQVPGAPTSTSAPPTATATRLQFTPTRTRTLPPGVPSSTPLPVQTPCQGVCITPTARRVAIAQPTPTTARAGAGNPPPPTKASAPTPAATQIALAPQEPTPEAEQAIVEESPNDDVSARVWQLLGIGAILFAGVLGLGALAFGVLTLFLLFRLNAR